MKIIQKSDRVNLSTQKENWLQLDVSLNDIVCRNDNDIPFRLLEWRIENRTPKAKVVRELTDEMKAELIRMGYTILLTERK
jgi:hypothetical protein